MSNFIQEEPILENQYTNDRTLKSFIKRFIPNEYISEIEKDLENLGNRVVTDILSMSDRKSVV